MLLLGAWRQTCETTSLDPEVYGKPSFFDKPMKMRNTFWQDVENPLWNLAHTGLRAEYDQEAMSRMSRKRKALQGKRVCDNFAQRSAQEMELSSIGIGRKEIHGRASKKDEVQRE